MAKDEVPLQTFTVEVDGEAVHLQARPAADVDTSSPAFLQTLTDAANYYKYGTRTPEAPRG